MLMATALLNKRLLEIERMRARNPQIKDPTPTLVDIERTHILNITGIHLQIAGTSLNIGYSFVNLRTVKMPVFGQSAAKLSHNSKGVVRCSFNPSGFTRDIRE